MKAPIRFLHEADATELDPETGQPWSELVVEMEPGPCIVCGRPARETQMGVLDEVYVERGVMRGKATCADCLEAQE
jgi:hypothetical protein